MRSTNYAVDDSDNWNASIYKIDMAIFDFVFDVILQNFVFHWSVLEDASRQKTSQLYFSIIECPIFYYIHVQFNAMGCCQISKFSNFIDLRTLLKALQCCQILKFSHIKDFCSFAFATSISFTSYGIRSCFLGSIKA